MWDLIVSVPDHCLSFYVMCFIWLNGLNFGFMLSTGISKIEYVHNICNAKRKSRWMLMLYWHMRRYTGMMAGFIFLGCLFM